MGDIRNYTCDCGYSEKIFVGEGMRAYSMPLAKQLFTKELEKLGDTVGRVVVDNALAECEHCKELRTVARCTCFHNGVKVGVFVKDTCQECNSKMKLHEADKIVACPKCGNEMSFHIAGMWD